MRIRQSVTRAEALVEARSLRSEHGENPEYDRALVELIYWTFGGESLESVKREVTTRWWR